MKIVTSFVYPPIPIRKFDWMAYIDGDDEEGPTGRGETEADALRDLAEILAEASAVGASATSSKLASDGRVSSGSDHPETQDLNKEIP